MVKDWVDAAFTWIVPAATEPPTTPLRTRPAMNVRVTIPAVNSPVALTVFAS
jgi:hypothetical protein